MCTKLSKMIFECVYFSFEWRRKNAYVYNNICLMREFIMVKFNVVALIELPSNGMAHFELQLNYSHVNGEFCSLFNFAAYTW